MHLTIAVPLLVTLCYSSAFDFDHYNIQWDVPMPGSKALDFPSSEESNPPEPTPVLPVLTLADLNLTSVDQDVADNLTDDSGLNLTYVSTTNVDPSPAQLTFTSNLTFPNDTLDDLVDEASDLADQAINASSKADPDVGPHPSYLSAWEMLSNFMEAEGGLAVLFTVISTGQFTHMFSIAPWIFAIT